jgi:hypothetical protein
MVERSLCEFYKGFFCKKIPKISRFQDNAQQENNFLICLIVPELGFNIWIIFLAPLFKKNKITMQWLESPPLA